MTQDRLTDTATFLLRVALGAMFLAHSLILKLFVFTLPGTAGFFGSIGLPGWFANGGWEYPLYLTLLAVVQAMLGDGAYALARTAPIRSVRPVASIA